MLWGFHPKKIVNKIKESTFFSVLADEAQDVSNMEQMPLVLRYIDNSGTIKEDFIKFAHCELGTSGQAIADLIKSEIASLDLSLDNCCGQGYDSARNISANTMELQF